MWPQINLRKDVMFKKQSILRDTLPFRLQSEKHKNTKLEMIKKNRI